MDIGITVSTDAFQAWEEMKLKKTYSYLIFTMSADGTLIEVEKKGAKEETFDDFVKALPPHEPRYCLYDYDYNYQDGRKATKLLYIFWSPDSCQNRKLKMVSATNNSTFQNKLKVVAIVIQANDFSDLEKSEVEKKIDKV